MSEIILFCTGILVGATVVWITRKKSQRDLIRLDEQKQLLEQEKQIVVDFMHNMVEAIGEGVNRQELFTRIVRAGMLSTGGLCSCIYEVHEEKKLKGVAVEGLFPPQTPLPSQEKELTRTEIIDTVLKSEIIPFGQGIVGAVAQSRKSIFIHDAQADPRITQHADPTLVIDSIIVAPIQFRHRLLGVIAVANPADGMAFTETDASLIESLAEQAALAIQNSDVMNLRIERNKIEMDLALASNVQKLLLPSSFPETNLLDIDTRYMPTRQVSGDLYDLIELGDNRFAVAIADVSGKGIPASLIMAICQSNLRNFAEKDLTPSEVFRKLNKILSGEIRKEMFVTVIYGIIDLNKEEFHFARAGHELPLIIHRGEDASSTSVEMVQTQGMAIGMVPSEIFDTVIVDKTIPFKKNDMLVLFTDGITEAVNEEGEEFSNERLMEKAKRISHLDACEFNDAILQTVKEFSADDNFGDDITLITIKRT